jgi:hypothetical protein
MRSLVIGILLVLHVSVVAQSVQVGLYQEQLVEKAVVYCSTGSFSLLVDGNERMQLEAGDILYLTLEQEGIKVLDSEHDLGHARQIELMAITPDAVFRIRPIEPELESRVYDDDLLVIAEDRFMTLVNRVDMDNTLLGWSRPRRGRMPTRSFTRPSRFSAEHTP